MWKGSQKLRWVEVVVVVVSGWGGGGGGWSKGELTTPSSSPLHSSPLLHYTPSVPPLPVPTSLIQPNHLYHIILFTPLFHSNQNASIPWSSSPLPLHTSFIFMSFLYHFTYFPLTHDACTPISFLTFSLPHFPPLNLINHTVFLLTTIFTSLFFIPLVCPPFSPTFKFSFHSFIAFDLTAASQK